MNNRGILIVLSGFSGAGKGTVVKNILKTYPDEYAVSVSATTRAPREGETDGREYFFKSTSEFQKMIATGELMRSTWAIITAHRAAMWRNSLKPVRISSLKLRYRELLILKRCFLMQC